MQALIYGDPMGHSESSVWWEVGREMRVEGGLVLCDILSGSVGADDLQPQRRQLLQLQLRPHSNQHGHLRRQSLGVVKSGPVVVTWIEARVAERTENGEASLAREPMFEGVVSEIRLAGPECMDRVRRNLEQERPSHLGILYRVVALVSCGWGSPAPAQGEALWMGDILEAAAVHSGAPGHGELIGPCGEVNPEEVRKAEG